MKKIFLSLAMVAMSAVAVNAQFLIGGSLGMNVNNETKLTNFSMSAVPTFGYAINENWEVGACVLLGGGVRNTTSTISFYDEELMQYVPKSVEEKFKSFNWAFEPYARYYFFNRNNWKVGIEGIGSVGGSLPIGVEGAGMSVTWGLNFMPVVTYSPKEHWVLIASCGFLGIGVNGVEKSCDFGLNVMNGGASQIGLGFAYMF
ncbi:MAG: hypothetical protein MJZ84_03385 [Paludibacteraceae bacterium]|nr:hypothetical protein [Paludibacteraceae bacterium]